MTTLLPSQRRRRRRLWIAACLGLVLIAGLLAWSGGRTRPEPTVTVGIYALTQSRGHPYKAAGPPHIYVHSALFDGLTVVAPGGAAQANLATSWEATSPTTWRFRLRPGVSFSNGEPFDARAVKAVFDWLGAPAGQATNSADILDTVKAVTVLEPHLVEFETHASAPTLPNALANVAIVAPGAWQGLGERGFAAAPVGTGPYRVRRWRAGEAVLEAWPGSWRPARTPVLRFVELAEESSRVQALQSGQIDLAIGVSPDSKRTLAEHGVRVHSQPAPNVMSLALVAERPGSPFRDVRVRQALNYAVDKEAIAERLLGGLARPAGQAVTPIAAGYDPGIQPYPYDPAKARRLLAAAGYPRGFPLTVEVTIGSLPADADVYAKVAQDLAAVGVPTEMRVITFPDWLRRFFKGDWRGRAFGMSYLATPRIDAVNALTNYSCLKSPPPAHICLPAMAERMQQAERTQDPALREARYRALMREAHAEALSLFLVEGVDLVGVGPKVEGYAPVIRWIPWERVEKRD